MFDKKDIQILKLLQSKGNLSTSDIAEQVNLSQSPTWRRINQFEKSGYIKGKVHLLNPDKLGMEMVVFASVNLSKTSHQALTEFEHAIKSFPEVVECYTMAGTIDYMLKIITRDIRQYELFIRKRLSELSNIREIHSHISLTRIKDTHELPLDTQLL